MAFDWSQARYADYGFVALDVTPGPGGRTMTTLRFINQQGGELDRVVFSRTAGPDGLTPGRGARSGTAEGDESHRALGARTDRPALPAASASCRS